jgi:putative two-component system response regulator
MGGRREEEAACEWRDVLDLLAMPRALTQVTRELVGPLAAVHPETMEHLAACGRVVLSLGRALGWCGPFLDRLVLAGLLHDVGKRSVPPALLAKPGALTAAEREAVQGHVEVGARLLDGCGLPELDLAAEVALRHHEWWNGGGYPGRLVGEDIPWAARFVAVVDVWDALRRERSYRLCLDEESALALLRHGAGSQFDPLVVECFVDLDPSARELAPIPAQLEPFPRLLAT